MQKVNNIMQFPEANGSLILLYINTCNNNVSCYMYKTKLILFSSMLLEVKHLRS